MSQQLPTWDVLTVRAESYYKMAEVALDSGDENLIQNALENMHFALELSMKAAITRNGGSYPSYGRRGHDLAELVLCKFADGTTSILRKAKLDKVPEKVNVGLSAWSMDCRYIVVESHPDMNSAILAYKELYLWIKESLLK